MKLQATKRKDGEFTYSIFLHKRLVEGLCWEKGDEIEAKLDGTKLVLENISVEEKKNE